MSDMEETEGPEVPGGVEVPRSARTPGAPGGLLRRTG